MHPRVNWDPNYQGLFNTGTTYPSIENTDHEERNETLFLGLAMEKVGTNTRTFSSYMYVLLLWVGLLKAEEITNNFDRNTRSARMRLDSKWMWRCLDLFKCLFSFDSMVLAFLLTIHQCASLIEIT